MLISLFGNAPGIRIELRIVEGFERDCIQRTDQHFFLSNECGIYGLVGKDTIQRHFWGRHARARMG